MVHASPVFRTAKSWVVDWGQFKLTEPCTYTFPRAFTTLIRESTYVISTGSSAWIVLKDGKTAHLRHALKNQNVSELKLPAAYTFSSANTSRIIRILGLYATSKAALHHLGKIQVSLGCGIRHNM